jgi:hypothetical protein
MSLHEQIQAFVLSKRGILLTADPITKKTQYIKVRCAENHEWTGRVDHFVDGCWCRYCSQPRRLNLKVLQEKAATHGGKLLSTVYVSNKDKYLWECAKGHQWLAEANNVLNANRWCWQCLKFTIEDIQTIAVKRGGICLSPTYIPGCRLQFRCAEGHEWETSFPSIQHGHWCRTCNTTKMERMCRAILEAVFQRPFPSQRPQWLQGTCGRSLELDCYNAELRLALEYQGRQHFEEIAFYGEGRLVGQQERDALKTETCKKYGVRLLVISDEVSLEELYECIIDECRELGIEIPVHEPIDAHQIRLVTRTDERLEALRTIAHQHGGQCLAESYINNYTRLPFRCKEGHEWPAYPTTITSGSWCSRCAQKTRLSIERINDSLHFKGVQTTDTYYDSARTPMNWRCTYGHCFKEKYDTLRARLKRSGRTCKEPYRYLIPC